MAECQSGRMQRLPGCCSLDQRCQPATCPGDTPAAATGVYRVPHYRMSQMLQVHPDLVGPAGV